MKKQLLGAIAASVLFVGGCTDEKESVPSDAQQGEETLDERLYGLEEEYDARLGLYAVDTGSGQTIAYQSDERFAYASTHKALAVGALLQQTSIEDLDKKIHFTADDLVDYSPITENNVETGMTLREISDASIRFSDNTAANLIFNEIGGPEEFKASLRAIGDDVTEPENIETKLNDVKPGETQDTSTAKALTESLRAFALEDVLEEEQRSLLVEWLKGNTTGDALIRAGVPDGWIVGDKTGSAAYGTRNDIGIIWPPDRAPIVLAVLSSRDEEGAETNDELIAKATEEIVNELIELN